MSILRSIFSSPFGGGGGENNGYALYGFDNFKDQNNTLILNHTSDSGHAWLAENGTNHANAAITNNRFVATPAGNIYTMQTNNLINCTVKGVLSFINSDAINEGAGIIGRKIANELTYYELSFLRTRGTVQLTRVLNNATLNLGSFATTFTSGDMTLELSMDGSSIKGFVNGVLQISATNSDILGAGKAGIRSNQGTATFAGIHHDYFEVNNLLK